jgi:mRNA interferase MazF
MKFILDPLPIINSFLDWLKVKSHLQVVKRGPVYFGEREIWWASIGANIGHEEDGKNAFFERPVIVLRKFNQHLFWAVPTTTKCKDNPYFFRFVRDGVEYCAIISQIRAMSSKRLLRNLGKLDEIQFAAMKSAVKSLMP